MLTQKSILNSHWNGSSREENKESPATQILPDSFLPPSVVPCAVLLLETPSGASCRKSHPKTYFKFSFEVPTSDLAKAVWFGSRQYGLCELAVCLGSNALVAIRLSLA